MELTEQHKELVYAILPVYVAELRERANEIEEIAKGQPQTGYPTFEYTLSQPWDTEGLSKQSWVFQHAITRARNFAAFLVAEAEVMAVASEVERDELSQLFGITPPTP